MPKGYINSQTSIHFMNYHFVWCPKYRKKILVGKVQKRLEELIREKSKELNSEILSLAIGDDHVHLFVRTVPTISPNKFIGQIKGYTSRILRQEIPEVKSRLPTLWTRSYFVSTHGHISDAMIKKYIDEQKGM
jgi:putative transposase